MQELSADDASHGHARHVFWQTYKVPILLGAGSIFLAVISAVLLVKSTQTAQPIQFSTDATASSVLGVTVDVAGAVASPGVYELVAGARVEDAIAAAGGFSQDADIPWIEKNLNRAMKINDGVKLFIPKKGEVETSYKEGCAAFTGDVAQSCITFGAGGSSSQNSTTISINMASQSELELLPGVGPVTAQKILTNRPYANLNELVTKKAMSQSLFDKVKNQLAL